MTGKRFKMIITSADGSFHYLDEITGEKITSTLALEDKLNELNNENKKLLQELEYYKQQAISENVKGLRENTVWEQMPSNYRTITKTSMGDNVND